MILVHLVVIGFCSIVIYFAGERFARSSSRLGDYCKLPRDVKGATFDAISSSLPELVVALSSVIWFKQFEVGVGTIAGSAFFNLLIIPGICVFVAPVAFRVSGKVISRDALFYVVAVFTLLVLLMYFKTWGIVIAVILLALYGLYIKDILSYVKECKKTQEGKESEKIQLHKELGLFFFYMVVIGGFTFWLTDSAIKFANVLGISPVIVAFTIIAAATSVPDTVVSYVNAKEGNIDDATSNVFGSNIFNIFVGIGFPLLILVAYGKVAIIQFDHLEIIFGLLGSTILVMYFFSKNNTLSKVQAGIMLFLFVCFIGYTIFLSFGG